MLDLQFIFGGKPQILSDVSLGVYDGRNAGFFVTNQVGSMGKAIQIELLEDHASLYSMAVASRKTEQLLKVGLEAHRSLIIRSVAPQLGQRAWHGA